MSNHLAVATVTAALRRRLQLTLDAEVPAFSARVAAQRPNAPASDLPATGINIFLFQVTPNAALRNADLPTRRGDGTLLQRPTAAVDLHYLLSFYGDDSRLEQQILLATTVRALHAEPVLSRQVIEDTVLDSHFDYVAGSDLVDALDLVRFTPTALSLEEMSKLWSVFFQAPYVLSVVYEAGVVLIDRDLPVQAPLPVRFTPNVYVVQSRQPVITAVLSQSGVGQPIVAGQPILSGYTLVLAGTQLQGTSTAVLVDGADTPTSSVTSEQIAVPLPSGMRAGTHGVQVIQQMSMGTPSVGHTSVQSNVVGFVLQPTTTVSATSTIVTLGLTPDVGKRQRVRLLLSQFGTPPGQQANTYAFEAPSRDVPGAPDQTGTVTIPISGVVAGTYLVRVQVDGAESPLGFDTAALVYNSPLVTIL